MVLSSQYLSGMLPYVLGLHFLRILEIPRILTEPYHRIYPEYVAPSFLQIWPSKPFALALQSKHVSLVCTFSSDYP